MITKRGVYGVLSMDVSICVFVLCTVCSIVLLFLMSFAGRANESLYTSGTGIPGGIPWRYHHHKIDNTTELIHYRTLRRCSYHLSSHSPTFSRNPFVLRVNLASPSEKGSDISGNRPLSSPPPPPPPFSPSGSPLTTAFRNTSPC